MTSKPQRTILLVQDDADLSDSIAACLEDDGYQVVTAGNGREALDKLTESETLPALILLDLCMPVMDGHEFRAAQLQQPKLSQVPVVLMSAGDNVRAAASALDAAGWMRIPVDLKALLELVANAHS